MTVLCAVICEKSLYGGSCCSRSLRSFQDIVTMMARQCTVHIAHLATMDVVFSAQKSNPQMHQTYIDQCITTAFSETKDLDLMLRLPPSTYDDIAADLSRPDAPLPLVLLGHPSPVARWARVWPAIAALPRLRRLHLKLDHDSESSWLIVNEQAILLRPLFAFSAQPRVQIYLSLPEVTHEEPPVSSLREDTWVPVSLRLNRFPRQRFFPERRIDGSIGIVYEEDVRKSFQIPGPDCAETMCRADLAMHMWSAGIDGDYLDISKPQMWSQRVFSGNWICLK